MSTVDVVQQSILRELLRGEVSPGTWIRQDELAKRLGVSKIPVREALQRLAGLGLLRFEPNRGVVVPELSAQDAEEIFSLRRSIEPSLLKRAIPRMTIVDLAEAELALTNPALSLTEANWEFHRALYRAAGWDRGLAMIEILHANVAPYVVLYTEGLGGSDTSDSDHADLLDACRGQESVLANRLLRHHLDQATSALTTFLRTPEQ